MKSTLHTLVSISKNHTRRNNFIEKPGQLILHFSEQIRNRFSISTLFKILNNFQITNRKHFLNFENIKLIIILCERNNCQNSINRKSTTLNLELYANILLMQNVR